MRHESLSTAVAECQRFLRRARALQAADRREPVNQLAGAREHVDGGAYPRQSGDLRRASMDLTRALADLRAGR